MQGDVVAVRNAAQIRLTKIRAKMREAEDRRMSSTFHPLRRGYRFSSSPIPHLLCLLELHQGWTRLIIPCYRPPLRPLLVFSCHLRSLTSTVRAPRSATPAPVSNLSVLNDRSLNFLSLAPASTGQTSSHPEHVQPISSPRPTSTRPQKVLPGFLFCSCPVFLSTSSPGLSFISSFVSSSSLRHFSCVSLFLSSSSPCFVFFDSLST